MTEVMEIEQYVCLMSIYVHNSFQKCIVSNKKKIGMLTSSGPRNEVEV